jgi:hypothetical protein
VATLTLRQLLVRTLTNIGEPLSAANVPTVGNPITDPYQLQLCNFINHIKEECEQEHQWSRRWQTFTMGYVSGNNFQQIYDIGGFFQPTGAFPYSGCQVVRQHNPKMGREVALCFDITTFGIPFVLDEMPLPDLIYYNTVLNQTPVAYSTNFVIQDLGNDNVNLLMYPGANTTRNIQITLYNPQQYADPTNGLGNQTDIWNTGVTNLSFNAPPTLGTVSGTLLIPWQYPSGAYTVTFTGPNPVTLGTGVVNQTITANFVQNQTAVTGFSAPVNNSSFSAIVVVQGFLSGGMGCDSPILIDSRPLELGSAWYALSERGESLGTNDMFSEDKYRRALDDLVSKDIAMQGDLMMIVA